MGLALALGADLDVELMHYTRDPLLQGFPFPLRVISPPPHKATSCFLRSGESGVDAQRGKGSLIQVMKI